MMDTSKKPILFLIYNRPDLTKRVLNRISKQKPPKLFVAADGPVKDNVTDTEKTNLTREIVLGGINWDCEVKTFFREYNVGCQQAVSEAITWFFSHVDNGIILEDDTLPDESFFLFVSHLLDYYESDNRIFQVGGCNYNYNIEGYDSTYFFSKYVNIWGWGTWKRAWEHFSNLNGIKAIDCLDEELILSQEIEFRKEVFIKTFKKEIDSWGYLWSLTVLSQHGLTIVPRKNLVSNIGFGMDATRTKDSTNKEANLIVESFDGNFKHPVDIYQDRGYNERIRDKIIRKTNITERIVNKIFRKG